MYSQYAIPCLLLAVMGTTSGREIPPGTEISQCKSQGVECPEFTLEGVKKDYEIRQYPALKWVCTSYCGTEPNNRAMFMKLFNYISGSNARGVKVPMTAPVVTVVQPDAGPTCGKNFTMGFYVPKAFQEDTPTPTDSEVFLKDTPAGTVYVRAFNGYASTDDFGAQSLQLKEALGNTTVVETAWLQVGYDSPFKFYSRRNEVAFMAMP